jgi:hypothetical protein
LNLDTLQIENATKTLTKSQLEKILDMIAKLENDILNVYNEENVLIGGIKTQSNLKNAEIDIQTTTNIDEFGTCSYSITRTTIQADGSVTKLTNHYSTWAASQSNCNSIANAHVAFLSGDMQF